MSGAFASKWEGWKNPKQRASLELQAGRINTSHPDAVDEIDDLMGVYAVLYAPTSGSRYVAYVGYSGNLSRELRYRYGQWEKEYRLHPRRACFPFAALYVPNQPVARAYEDDLIRYYAPPWNTKFHR